MEHELSVVWLVKTSERARAAVALEFGADLALKDVLRRISRFGQSEERLAVLMARIQAEFTPPTLPTVFTGHHLRMLVDSKVVSLLAGVLHCAPADVFVNLLDSNQLARALRDSGHTKDEIADAELLLLVLLPRLPRLAARHGLDARDWGTFVERHGWLTPMAVEQLTEQARSREWPQDARPTQILAGILDGVDTRTTTGPSSRFDALALVELRRRIGLLAEQLRGDAMDHAEEAALLAPELSSVSRLPAWLELYERDAMAVGMRRLFTGSVSLAELLRGNHTEPPPVTGEPVPSEGLEITNELSFGVWKRRVAFDITCLVQGDSTPQVILRCRGLRKEDYGPVRDMIRQVRGSDLALVGKTLGERLLNTQVAQRGGLRGHLRLALNRYGAETVQCVVLTGVQQPIAVPAPWHEYLATTLPYEAPPTHDTRFPDLDHVERELRASAAGRRIEEVQ